MNKYIRTSASVLAAASMVFPGLGCHRSLPDDRNKRFQPQVEWNDYDQDDEIRSANGGAIPWWYWWGYHPGYTYGGGHYVRNSFATVPGSPIYRVSSGGGGWFGSGRSSASSTSTSGGKSSATSGTARGGLGGSSAAHAGGGGGE